MSAYSSRLIKSIPFLLVLLLSLLFANLQTNKRSGGNDACWNISGDGRGYYAWLPAIFIYHDLNFAFEDSIERKVPDCGLMPIQEYRYNFHGKDCNKYYPGAATLMLPFFTVAHLYTKYCTPYPANGYSKYYFRIMGYSGALYYLLGMLFFLGILRLLGLNNWQKCVSALLVTFGTNIIYYCIDTPVWSHIYSFAMMSAFIYYSLQAKNHLKPKYIIYLSLLLGLIFITRPVNTLVILFLTFLFWESKPIVIDFFRQQPLRLSYLFAGAIMPIILFSLYKISTGNFIIYSYKNEGFNFLHPHLWQFMFHYDNGIFPYTPLLFMPSVFIFAWYRKENKYLIIGVFVTLAAIIYVNSAWWFWAFGLSFGSRTMLDFVPLFGIPIALSIKQVGKRHLYYLLPIYVLCCTLTMILYNQKSAHGYMAQLSAHITDYWPALLNGLGVK